LQPKRRLEDPPRTSIQQDPTESPDYEVDKVDDSYFDFGEEGENQDGDNHGTPPESNEIHKKGGKRQIPSIPQVLTRFYKLKYSK